mgnify:CR=1 FL=1
MPERSRTTGPVLGGLGREAPRARLIRAGFDELSRAAGCLTDPALTALLPEAPDTAARAAQVPAGPTSPTGPLGRTGISSLVLSPAQEALVTEIGRTADPDLALLSLVRLAEACTGCEAESVLRGLLGGLAEVPAHDGPGTGGAGSVEAPHAVAEHRARLLAVLGSSSALGDFLVAHPLHLAALAGPLQGAARTLDPHGCGPITAADLGKLFPDAPLRRLDGLAAELTARQLTGKIDTPARRAHFFGQVRQEVGSDGRLDENLNYSPAGLKALFSYFAKHPAEAELYGRTDKHPANPEAIANRAYANRNGNGDVASGDGWLFRGRGLKQLTGRANYRAFTQTHARLFGEALAELVLQHLGADLVGLALGAGPQHGLRGDVLQGQAATGRHAPRTVGSPTTAATETDHAGMP